MRVFACSALVLIGCDTTAVLYPKRTVFLEARVVSTWPAARNADGTWDPVCDARREPTGVITNVALIGSLRTGAPGDPLDEDVSIRPGDVVDMRVVSGESPSDIHLTPGNVALTVSCLDPLSDPEANPSDDPDACDGTVPAAALDRIDYHANTPDRWDPNEVLILVDMSGSLSGLVDGETLLEPQPNQFDALPDDLALVASDANARRIATAQDLIHSLNPIDRVGVMFFGEDVGGGVGLSVPCGSESGMAPDPGLGQCFGTNHAQWVGPGSLLSRIGSRTMGRSNLWRALDVAYDFMADPERTHPSGAARHIVVLTDGPDTCAGSHQTPGTSACSSVLAADVHARLAAAGDDPNAPRVQLHFVQFEAAGYPGRDPDQITAACLTRGHHRFIDTNAIHGLANPTAQAFRETALDVRFTLMGHWELAAAMPALTSDAAVPDGTPAGLYALGGRLTIGPGSHLVAAETMYGFAGNVPWDRRPSVLEP